MVGSQLSAVRVGAVWVDGRNGGLGYSPCTGLTARGGGVCFGIRWKAGRGVYYVSGGR